MGNQDGNILCYLSILLKGMAEIAPLAIAENAAGHGENIVDQCKAFATMLHVCICHMHLILCRLCSFADT